MQSKCLLRETENDYITPKATGGVQAYNQNKKVIKRFILTFLFLSPRRSVMDVVQFWAAYVTFHFVVHAALRVRRQAVSFFLRVILT